MSDNVEDAGALDALARHKFEALSPAETGLVSAAATGAVHDCPPKCDASIPNATSVRAEFLRWLCESNEAAPYIHAKGLRLRGARVLGHLDLEAVNAPFGLSFEKCAILEGVTLDGASFSTLQFDGADIGSFYARSLKLRGALQLQNSRIVELQLQRAEIPNSLRLENARLVNPGNCALNLEGATIGSVYLNRGFKAYGHIRLYGTTIRNGFECNGVVLAPRGIAAILIEHSRIEGPILLRASFRALGGVRIFEGSIGGSIDFQGAILVGRSTPALLIDGARIEGSLLMRENRIKADGSPFYAKGSVLCRRLTLGQTLDLDGARIRNRGGDAFELIEADIKGRLRARSAQFTGKVLLTRTSVASDIDLTRSTVSGSDQIAIEAIGLRCGGSLALFRTRTTGVVNLRGALIADMIHATYSQFRNKGGVAIALDNVKVGASALFCDSNVIGDFKATNSEYGTYLDLTGIRVAGNTSIMRANIRSDLYLGRAYFRNPAAIAFSAGQVTIGGSLYWHSKVRVRGSMSFYNAEIMGDAYGRDVRISGSHEAVALSLASARIGGSMVLTESTVHGGVDIAGIRTGGRVALSGSRVTGKARTALDVRGATVEGDLQLDEGFRAVGLICLDRLSAGGAVDLSSSRIRHRYGPALELRNARIGAGLDLSDTRISGGVAATNMTVGGAVDFKGAFIARRFAPALDMTGASIGDRVSFERRFVAMGSTLLDRTTINGAVRLAGCTIHGRGGRALSMIDSHVRGDIDLGTEATEYRPWRSAFLDGSIDLSKAVIEGDVDLSRLTLGIKNSDGISASRATIKGTLDMGTGFDMLGPLNLRATTVGAIIDSEDNWRKHVSIELDGLTYGSIHPDDADTRRRWLRHAVDGPPRTRRWCEVSVLDRSIVLSWQPFEQLTQNLQKLGRETDAKTIAMEKQQQITRYTGNSLFRALRRFYGISTGYGYKPQRAAWAAPVFIAALAIFLSLSDPHILKPTQSEAAIAWRSGKPLPDGYPRVEPLVYAVDSFVPIVKLGPAASWQPDPDHRCAVGIGACGSWLQRYMWLYTLLGALVTGLTAAGYAGLVRRG